MAAVVTDLHSHRLNAILEPVVKVKLSLMAQITSELKSRYGTQQVAADAMEMHQSEISALYNERPDRFSIVFLIHLAGKLGKKVTVAVN